MNDKGLITFARDSDWSLRSY